ncbi:MAG: GNAT family N-acetyltransferase [Rhizobiaceae bacterium]
MDRKAAYRKLSDTEASLPLFLRAWWLDATCGDAWDVVLAKKGDEIHAALPFLPKRVRGFRILTQPKLTPFLGPWLRPTGAKSANDYARQKDLMNELIDGLPPHDHYRQNWSPNVTNWLPFYWRGFAQTTRYTYSLEGLTASQDLWGGLRDNIRREIRRAENRMSIGVADGTLKEFLDLSDLTFKRQGRKPPYSRDYVQRIDTACADRGCRRIFIARDPEGRQHAGAYIVWTDDSAYYLMGGGDPAVRNSGAMSLCMWRAIEFAATVTRRFDFEGSMIEPVERFFRAFGAQQTPYFNIQKTPSFILHGLMGLSSVVRTRR